jgi:hypothetical protein
MSLVIVETVTEKPMTDADLQEADEIGLPCLQAHGVTWRYSLLSSDRYQMICLFDAPDAMSVRNSYAKLGVDKRAIWAGELLQPQDISLQQDLTELYVIQAHYPVLSEAEWNEVQQKFVQCCTASGVKWLRSYVSLDRTRVIYELDAPDADSLGEVQRQAGLSRNGVWMAQRLLP